MQPNKIVSRDEWLAARKAHLKNEKALTRMRDLVSAERRALPWVKVEKEYVFDTTEGKKTLAELFGRNSQLIVHHFMWLWDQGQGCPSCSLEADHAEGALVHLENHDVTYVRRARRLANWRHTNSGWDGPPNGRHPMATISTTTTTYRLPKMIWRRARSITTIR